jgi:hypothetical protein
MTPGISGDLDFEVLDDTFLKIDLTGYTSKLEVINDDTSLRLTSSNSTVVGLGEFKVSMPDVDTLKIGSGQYQYRLILTDASSKTRLAYKGFITMAEPVYNIGSVAPVQNVVLADGSLFLNAPDNLSLGVWYSTLNPYRLLVSGSGVLSLDLRHSDGYIDMDNERFVGDPSGEAQWVFWYGPYPAIRINQHSGTNTIRFAV